MVVGSMTVETDVVILGAGPGGYIAALRAAQLGKDVIVVEKEKQMGGVCLRCGCIPTKAVIHSSDYYNKIKQMGETGVIIDNFKVDINKMIDWKDGIVDKMSGSISNLFKKYGIEQIEGKGVFQDSTTLRIEGKSDVQTIKFKKAIIATGSSPVEIPGFPFSSELVLSSKDALSLKEIPKRLLIIGGGYIGLEMGTVYGKLGSQVDILEMAESLISILPSELVSVVEKKLTQYNITAHKKTKALGMKEQNGKALVKFEKEGKEESIEADRVLVVVGRKPNSKDFGLENTKVKVNDHGFIEIDETCKTTDENIFAVGDVTGNPMLAHRASKQGKVAAEVIAGQKSAFDNKVIPSVVFNDPEIASVGYTEAEAKEKGHEVVTGKYPMAALGRALTMHEADGFVKVIGDKKTGLLLGVHAVCPNASDIISEAALAIEMGATMEDVALTIHPHPTIGEAMMEATEAALGTSAHLFRPPQK